MRKSTKNDRKKLLPLRVIAQDSPYSAAYLSVLVQRGKLKTEKVGRNYYSTKQWFRLYMQQHARDDKRGLQSPVQRMVQGARLAPISNANKQKKHSLLGFVWQPAAKARKNAVSRHAIATLAAPAQKTGWLTRLMDFLLILTAVLLSTLQFLAPINARAAMQSDSYVIYDFAQKNLSSIESEWKKQPSSNGADTQAV